MPNSSWLPLSGYQRVKPNTEIYNANVMTFLALKPQGDNGGDWEQDRTQSQLSEFTPNLFDYQIILYLILLGL